MSTEREKILQAAQKWVDKKKFDKAILEYQKLVQQDPKDSRTLLKVGDLQARMGQYEAAIATYDRVGQHYATQGFALKAIAVYKQIRELIKKHAPELTERYAHVVPKLAEIYTQLGLTSDALATFDEVATGHLRSGRDNDAIETFKKMVELDSTNPLPHLRLAEACCRVQAVDAAIDSFWTAAQLLLELARHDDALKVVERILHFRPDPSFARVAAQLYLERGTREDALQALAKLQVCFQANPKDLDTLGLLAQSFTLLGQESKALEVYKEMARISKDQGRQDLFAQLVAHLVAVAPNDDAVRALQSVAPPPPPARPAEVAVSVRDSEVEMLGDSMPPSVSVPRAAPLGVDPAWQYRPGQASAPDVVVVDDDRAVAQEAGAAPSSFDPRSHMRKALVDAESFRKLRLYSKAVEALQIALEIDPRSVTVRQKLREVLAEAGDRDGAIGETLQLATIQLENGETALAEALLYEVIEAEPEHAAALELLEQIGGQPFGEEAPTVEGFEHDAPLPSYDLEEVGADQALSNQRAPMPSSLDADDPFGGAPTDVEVSEEPPLPSFRLDSDDDLLAGLNAGAEAPAVVEDLPDFDDDVAEAAQSLDDDGAGTLQAESDENAPLPSFGDPDQSDSDEGDTDWDDASDAGAAPAPRLSLAPGTGDVEEVLDEAEFFAMRGLFDDARAIITEALARMPNHPLLLERLQEVDELASGQSGTIERSALGAGPASEPAGSDRAFDIAASLDALDDLGEVVQSGGAKPTAGFASQVQEVDVDQVFAKFKEGVRAQVADGDAATHYDLGVAYKEMGLLVDAIGEFELAARDPMRECMCCAMIGMIHLERGELDKSLEAYIRGLSAPEKNVDQEMSLYYDLGTVQEMKGSPEDALYYFKKIARRDPGYRDVKDRIATLQPQTSAPASSSRKVNTEEDFDKAFDDLFESK